MAMTERTGWNRFVAWCRKAWRIVWRKYNKEIKSFIGNLVDNAFVELGKHVDSNVQKSIKNEIIQKAVAEKVDIYTSSGAVWVKDEIDFYMEKFGR